MKKTERLYIVTVKSQRQWFRSAVVKFMFTYKKGKA